MEIKIDTSKLKEVSEAIETIREFLRSVDDLKETVQVGKKYRSKCKQIIPRDSYEFTIYEKGVEVEVIEILDDKILLNVDNLYIGELPTEQFQLTFDNVEEKMEKSLAEVLIKFRHEYNKLFIKEYGCSIEEYIETNRSK